MNDEQKREECLTAMQILSDNRYNTKLLDSILDKITKTGKEKGNPHIKHKKIITQLQNGQNLHMWDYKQNSSQNYSGRQT